MQSLLKKWWEWLCNAFLRWSVWCPCAQLAQHNFSTGTAQHHSILAYPLQATFLQAVALWVSYNRTAGVQHFTFPFPLKLYFFNPISQVSFSIISTAAGCAHSTATRAEPLSACRKIHWALLHNQCLSKHSQFYRCNTVDLWHFGFHYSYNLTYSLFLC